MKVDFINIGPGRCGTSWLYQLFESHPDISLPVVKETEFFNHNWHRGSDWYESLFLSAGRKGCIRGEISNMYYCDRSALLKIKAYNPNIKIIFNYRNPYDLLVSFMTFGIRRGLEIPQGDFIKSYPIGMLMGSGYTDRLSRGCLSEGDMVPVFDSVMLSRFIVDVYEVFGRDNVFIFNYESLSTDSEMMAKRIFEFLGVGYYRAKVLDENSVNGAAEPRLKFLGRFASIVASNLRRYQFYSILTFLHNNTLVKRLILKPAVKDSVSIDDAMKDQLISEAGRANTIISSHVT
jgi:hypothetical protein